MRRLREKWYTIIMAIPLFEMDNIYSTLWNVILMVFFSLNFLVVPLHISFELEQSNYYNSLWFLFHELPIYLLATDIVHSLNTAYYSKGVYVKERKKIIKYYFKWNFWLDICILIPLILVLFEIEGLTILHLNFLMITVKLQIITTKLENFFQFKDKPQGIINLLKLIFKVLSIAHLCGCAWHYIAKWEISDLEMNNTWLNYVKVQNDDWQVRYVNSLYFSIVTMVTVGYGDISPQNTVEKSFSIIIITLSCGFFAYALNSVGIILKEMYREDDHFKFIFFIHSF